MSFDASESESRLARALAEFDTSLPLIRGGSSGVTHAFNEVDHPRARGKFARKLGEMKPGDVTRLPSGVTVHRTVGDGPDPFFGYRVAKGAKSSFHIDRQEAADKALALHHQQGGRRLNEALVDVFGEQLEEWPLHSGGSLLRLQFDPGAHPRDRLGKFSEVLANLRRTGKNGSRVELPHGVLVTKHRGGFMVTHRSGAAHLMSEHAAAADALGRYDGAAQVDPSSSFLSRMAELRTARAATMTDFGADTQHLEGLMRQARAAHNPATAAPEIGKHRGRRAISRDAYRMAHPAPALVDLIRNSDEITAALGRVRARRAAATL